MKRDLTDRFGRRHTYLRISVTDRCNLRCSYCMPSDEEIIWKSRDELLTFEEIERVARLAIAMGIEKIRLTGGEPFVRKGIEELIVGLKAIPGLQTLAMTTNGLQLSSKLHTIRDSIDAFNISLDTFRRDRFLELTGRDRLRDVLASIHAVLDAGYRNLKVNAVIMRGVNDDELLDFARYAELHPITVRFIEFMPFSGNAWSDQRCVPMMEMLRQIESEYHLESIPEDHSPISRDFHLINRSTGQLGEGRIGVIASMSQPFCSQCSRLRLTAEGKVMPCLHSPLEFDLRTILRQGGTDKDIANVFHTALDHKPEEHPGADEMIEQGGRVMIQIGG